MKTAIKVYRRTCALCGCVFRCTGSLEGVLNPMDADDDETVNFVDARRDYEVKGVSVVVDYDQDKDEVIRQTRCVHCDESILQSDMDEDDVETENRLFDEEE